MIDTRKFDALVNEATRLLRRDSITQDQFTRGHEIIAELMEVQQAIEQEMQAAQIEIDISLAGKGIR